MTRVVATLGDLLLDVSSRLSGPILRDTDTASENHLDAGGQAANVAAWAAAAGVPARLVAVRSTDPAGRLAEDRIRARGVEVVGPVARGPCGIVVALVDQSGDRSMLTDRGAATALSPADLAAVSLHDVGWLHVSGYSLAIPSMRAAAAAACVTVRSGGGRISCDLASTAAIASTGPAVFSAALAALAPDIAFATEEELAALGGPVEAPVVVVKLGRHGARLVTDAGWSAFAAVPVDVVDSVGAGDALAGGMLAALLAGRPEREALEAGMAAAARCLTLRGALPPA